MLIHMVCWKYRPEIDEAARSDHRARLRNLENVIPGLDRFWVGSDILHLDRSFDTGLVAHFADIQGLDAYTVHPEHQAVAAIGRTLAEQVVSVDFLDERTDNV